jgi:hypothetical protein
LFGSAEARLEGRLRLDVSNNLSRGGVVSSRARDQVEVVAELTAPLHQIVVRLEAEEKAGRQAEIAVSRRSVSAVIARLPRTTSLIRRGGTRSARADWLRANGRKNSSIRICPGVGFGSRLASVIVDDLDIGRPSIPPTKTDAPSIIDAD